MDGEPSKDAKNSDTYGADLVLSGMEYQGHVLPVQATRPPTDDLSTRSHTVICNLAGHPQVKLSGSDLARAAEGAEVCFTFTKGSSIAVSGEVDNRPPAPALLRSDRFTLIGPRGSSDIFKSVFAKDDGYESEIYRTPAMPARTEVDAQVTAPQWTSASISQAEPCQEYWLLTYLDKAELRVQTKAALEAAIRDAQLFTKLEQSTHPNATQTYGGYLRAGSLLLSGYGLKVGSDIPTIADFGSSGFRMSFTLAAPAVRHLTDEESNKVSKDSIHCFLSFAPGSSIQQITTIPDTLAPEGTGQGPSRRIITDLGGKDNVIFKVKTEGRNTVLTGPPEVDVTITLPIITITGDQSVRYHEATSLKFCPLAQLEDGDME